MEKKTDEGVKNAKYTHGYGVQVQYYVPSKLSKNIECNKKRIYLRTIRLLRLWISTSTNIDHINWLLPHTPSWLKASYKQQKYLRLFYRIWEETVLWVFCSAICSMIQYKVCQLWFSFSASDRTYGPTLPIISKLWRTGNYTNPQQEPLTNKVQNWS